MVTKTPFTLSYLPPVFITFISYDTTLVGGEVDRGGERIREERWSKTDVEIGTTVNSRRARRERYSPLFFFVAFYRYLVKLLLG